MTFKKKKAASKQKLRGGYYTPEILSDFVTDWGLSQGARNIIEPSCGDGNFLESCNKWLSRRRRKTRITAVEIDEVEIKKARVRSKNFSKNIEIDYINSDFFSAYGDGIEVSSYDLVLGNPPFLRFQYFEDRQREIAFSHLREAGYRPNKLANAWAGFVQLSIELLATNGCLAMVLPAELLQVKYARELRDRIVQNFEHVILVSFKKLVFPSIQQEVVLLLAQNKTENLHAGCDIHTVEISDGDDLNVETLNNRVTHSPARHSHSGMKWTSLYLKESTFKTLQRIGNDLRIPRLGDLASVNVGIVTGNNDFFVVSDETVEEYSLQRFVVPVVGRTNAIGNIFFKNQELKATKQKHRSNLLDTSRIPEHEFTDGLIEYLRLGVEDKVNEGYKCRIRQRWFDVPSIYRSDGFMFRQIHMYPLMVTNSAGAACTDTIHRFAMRNGDSVEQVCCAFINSLSFAWSEICGRSYGGGVLELEPREAEEIPVPYNAGIQLDYKYIENSLKTKEIDLVLDYVDQELLVKTLNYTAKDVKLLRSAWKTLRDRRIQRK